MAHLAVSPRLAPEGAFGVEQIIPTLGAHEQIYASHEQIVALVAFGHIYYDPEYGPYAKVYHPVGFADAERVRSWLG